MMQKMIKVSLKVFSISAVEPQDLVNIPTDLGAQFTEIFIKTPENVELIISFVDVSCEIISVLDTDFPVHLYT